MWFLENLERVNTERKAIADLISEVDWLDNVDWNFYNSQLSLDANIIVDNHPYAIKMVYPSTFPASPPYVRPVDPDASWSTHQYGAGGDLCLEWGPDNWQQTITGAALLRSAYKLLNEERPHNRANGNTVVVPSRHHLNIGQEIRGKVFRFLIHYSTQQYINKIRRKRYCIIGLNLGFSRESWTIYIASLTISKNNVWENPLFPKELEKPTVHHRGVFYRTHISNVVIRSLDTSGLLGKFEQEGLDLKPLEDSDIRYVLISDNEGGLHLYSRANIDEWISYETLYLQNPDIAVRLGPLFEKYQEAKVGIVGLGSAGSKIATSLARSGIRNFCLYDYDLFLPENLCRHTLSWEDVGQHKVDGITHSLLLIDSNIKVLARRLMLTGQEASSSVSSALSQLTKCDIIIDATADSRMFNLLSTVSYQSDTPYIWMEIFEGGIGGFLGRFRPKLEPEPIVMRAALLSYLETQEAPELTSHGDYSAADSEGNIVVATDADVSVIAGYATNMVLDILAQNDSSIFPHSMYLIGLRKGWIFEEPFDTKPLDAVLDKSIPVKEAIREEETTEAVEFIKGLISKIKE